MSDVLIQALEAKRDALVAQIKEVQSQVYHIDGAISALGGKPIRRTHNRFFAPGELIRLIGEAERSGLKAPREIAGYIMKIKKLDEADKAMVRRIRWSVTDCRKRMNAKGA